jgi:hypothetical protein
MTGEPKMGFFGNGLEKPLQQKIAFLANTRT